MAQDDPSVQHRQQYQAACEHDLHWLGAAMIEHYHGDDGDLKLLMEAVAKAYGTVSVED
jgi:hypothetical protein